MKKIKYKRLKGGIIPDMIQEKIAKDYHLSGMNRKEISKKYSISPASIDKYASKFQPSFFYKKRQKAFNLWTIIERRAMLSVESSDIDLLEELAEVLAKKDVET